MTYWAKIYRISGVHTSPVDFTSITHRFWNSHLSQSYLSGQNAVYFMLLKPFTECQFLFHLVPITVGRPEALWIQSLPTTFTQSNRKHDLMSNAWGGEGKGARGREGKGARGEEKGARGREGNGARGREG